VKVLTEFPDWLGHMANSRALQMAYVLNSEFGGGIILFRNLDNQQNKIGIETAAMFVDQIENITESTFHMIMGNMRWPGVERPKLVATSNPGGIGGQWVKAYWIQKHFPYYMNSIKDQFYFIKATPSDNPHLPKSYWNMLDSLPPHLRHAWVEGDYDSLGGLAFPQLVTDVNAPHSHVIKPRPINDNWTLIRGIDFGYDDHFACVWVARDNDTGRYYVYRTIKRSHLIDKEQAARVKSLTGSEKIAVTYADPSMWGRGRGGATFAGTNADAYAMEGVWLLRGDNDRIMGTRKIERLLAPLADGEPGLLIFDTCQDLIDELKSLTTMEGNPDDVNAGDDHLYDALRYALSNVTVAPALQKETKRPDIFRLRNI
jgi:phage terminase large subunit